MDEKIEDTFMSFRKKFTILCREFRYLVASFDSAYSVKNRLIFPCDTLLHLSYCQKLFHSVFWESIVRLSMNRMYSKDLKYRMYIKHHIYVLLHKYNQYTWLVWNEFYYNNCYLYMSIENNSLFLTIFGSKTFVAWQSTTLKSIWKVKNNSILISLSIS